MPALTNLQLDGNYLYGPLPNFNGSSSLKNLSIKCNFFSGAFPSTQPPVFIFSGNCFSNYDDASKMWCTEKNYPDCDSFQQVAHGKCPTCPVGQVIEDFNTCVCTLEREGGGPSIKAIVGSAIGSCLLLLATLWLIWAKCYKRLIQQASTDRRRHFKTQGPIEFWKCPDGVVRFNLKDLARATGDFNSQHEIGVGGFGKVFYAFLDGRDVAIKRAHLSSIKSSAGFQNEVLLLSRLHHKNLVRLLGFCEDEGIQILVYEYMPNGNLDTLLFKNNVSLDWLKRLDIAIGVAQGLEYLHSFADPPVIHRDVKPSNILLDEDLVAKLSDFGLSKTVRNRETHFVTRPAGTVGFIDPQYVLREQLTTASDVYSFGVVLLEAISGQKVIDYTRMDECNLVEWVKLKLDSDGLKGVVDPRLGDRFPFHIYQDIVRLAIDCASFKTAERPSMKAVLTILDACRWSVSPHILELGNDGHIYGPEKDADVTDQQGIVRNLEHSITDETSNTLDVSLILPR